jgi:hypothetical protein
MNIFRNVNARSLPFRANGFRVRKLISPNDRARPAIEKPQGGLQVIHGPATSCETFGQFHVMVYL